MRIIETNVYKFDELSQTAKAIAVNRLSDINIDHGWWDCVYDDAKNVGIKIKSFDLDRNRDCEIEVYDYCETSWLILDAHGKECDTYTLAEEFRKDRDNLVESAPKDENGEFENEYALGKALDSLEYQFKKDLAEEYSLILQREYDYLTSTESIIDTILANEYEFTDKGQLI